METLQTTVETELQSKENNAIVLWAMDYKEAHDEMGFEVTVPQLIEMLISFKKEFTDKDWYNAGIMAQRILQNDEIETLKKKLKQEEFNHTNTRISWDKTSSERDELKIKNKALERKKYTWKLSKMMLKMSNEELHENYQLLCANCHTIKTYNETWFKHDTTENTKDKKEGV